MWAKMPSKKHFEDFPCISDTPDGNKTFYSTWYHSKMHQKTTVYFDVCSLTRHSLSDWVVAAVVNCCSSEGLMSLELHNQIKIDLNRLQIFVSVVFQSRYD